MITTYCPLPRTVAPRVGAWIETAHLSQLPFQCLVAPRVGACLPAGRQGLKLEKYETDTDLLRAILSGDINKRKITKQTEEYEKAYERYYTHERELESLTTETKQFGLTEADIRALRRSGVERFRKRIESERKNVEFDQKKLETKSALEATTSVPLPNVRGLQDRW